MIVIKSEHEIEKIAAACATVAGTIALLRERIAPGMTTRDLEAIAVGEIKRKGGTPAFKGYRGYPGSICTSVNNEVVHGIPSGDVSLREGDIVSIDIGVLSDGFYGDAAVTLPVGEVSDEATALMEATREALDLGIGAARPGGRLSDISRAVQGHVESRGYSVVRAFVGHGIGKRLHEEPHVPNFVTKGLGVKLQAGMTLAIEPMVNAGDFNVDVLDDGWTAVTRDGSLSAHFEHTVVITPGGPRVLTQKV